MWIIYAFGSALFAGVTSILAKCGIKETDSNVATAVRTIVVLIFSWIMVFLVGAQGEIVTVEGRTWLFLILSGLATGASWLCYFRALQTGDVNKVVPIDKSGTILTIILAFLFLHESVSLLKAGSVILIGVGTYLMIQKKAAHREKGGCAEPGSVSAGQRESVAEPGNANAGQRESVAEPGKVRAGQRESVAEPGRVNTMQKDIGPEPLYGRRSWFLYACLSAVFASLTSILGKVGISGLNSNLGTAIRTAVVLVMAWVVVFVTKKQHTVKEIPGRELLFICLSGLATGGSWLCYYRALQEGPASVVVPVDKLSILVTIAFSYLVFHEKLSKKAFWGLMLIVAGTVLMIVADGIFA